MASEKTVESLITLYTHVGQPEAASGLLMYAYNYLGFILYYIIYKGIDLRLSSHENLHRWEDAF